MKNIIKKILKEETENKNIYSIVEMIRALFNDVVVDIEVGEIRKKPLIRVQIKTDDPAVNIDNWYAQQMVDIISDYTGGDFKLIPWWSSFRRDEVFDAYIDVYRKRYDDEGNTLKESKDDIQKNLSAIRDMLKTISWDGLCDIWVEYNNDDKEYEIRSKYVNKGDLTIFDIYFNELEFLERTLKSMGLRPYIFAPYFVEKCEDEVEFLD